MAFVSGVHCLTAATINCAETLKVFEDHVLAKVPGGLVLSFLDGTLGSRSDIRISQCCATSSVR
jgi:hypothetical protein